MLYSFEEICDGCVLAHWHDCVNCFGGRSFCHCEEHHERSVDCVRGECEEKTLEWRNES